MIIFFEKNVIFFSDFQVSTGGIGRGGSAYPPSRKFENLEDFFSKKILDPFFFAKYFSGTKSVFLYSWVICTPLPIPLVESEN